MGKYFNRNIVGFGLGSLLAVAFVWSVGAFFLLSDWRPSQALIRTSYNWSFDYSFFPRPNIAGSEAVIIYIDEQSLIDLHQRLDAPMDRSLHAKLLDYLKKEGARAVVMDMMFTDKGPSEKADAAFAEALRSNGRVVIGVDFSPNEQNFGPGSITTERLTYPYRLFLQTNVSCGLVVLQPDSDFMVRRHYHRLENELEDAPPSLSWAAARLAGVKLAQNPAQMKVERWVNYYGPPGAIPNVSYERAYNHAEDLPPGYFRNKVVFIGARPKTGVFNEKRDELRSPYSVKGREFLFMPMVEIHATQFLNLARGDWLRRASSGSELGILLLTALFFGAGLYCCRPWLATGIAFMGGLGIVIIAQALFAHQHRWFPWLIILVVQIPSAWLYSILAHFWEWYRQRRKLESERRRAHERIREQAALLDKAQDAILVHDLDWRAQYWNKSAENLYGWSFDEVQQLNLKDDVFKIDGNKMLEALQVTLSKGEWTGELRQNNKAGKSLLIQSRWTLVRDEQGRAKSILVINTDVTEQKKLEAQFLRTQRMESIGTLAGGIAHDLNNVLSPILMGVEIMRMKSNNDEAMSKMLTTMSSSARRGSDMVKQVLTFARGHEGERSVLQVSHLVREMQKIVKETFPKSIEFKTALGDALWPILGDATQIHQIILNLCVNARDAMPNGGQIIVTLKNVTLTEGEAKQHVGAKPIQYLLLAVEDNGTGIPPEIIDKIFEPFFTTKEIGKGTGLGLSTVISIIKSHGGFLDLQSKVGKGTTFNVYLPAAAEAVVAASEPAPPEALRGEGETVMLVDDEPAVLDLTRELLTHFGYKVVTAIHGADAVALFPQYKDKIKVLVIDMMMPVMDGPTAIRALRKLQPKLPIIAISGLMAGDKIQEQLGDVGVVFIPKPFTSEKLLLAIRDVVIKDHSITRPVVAASL